MRRRTAVTALVLTVAVAGAGCGSGSSAGASPGRALFAGSCSACHSLTGHDSPARQGGDLLGVHLRRTVALQFAREMPVRRPLTGAELGAIVDYIAGVQRVTAPR